MLHAYIPVRSGQSFIKIGRKFFILYMIYMVDLVNARQFFL